MSEHPVVACYRGLDSAAPSSSGRCWPRRSTSPLGLVGAHRYEPVSLSASDQPAPTTTTERRRRARCWAARASSHRVPGAARGDRPGTDVADALVWQAAEAERAFRPSDATPRAA
jgi:hypothetical protein